MKNKKGFLAFGFIAFSLFIILVLSIMFYSKVSAILGYLIDNWWWFGIIGIMYFFKGQVLAIMNTLLRFVGVKI